MNEAHTTARVPTCSACNSNYVGMTALVGKDGLIYLGKAEHYHFRDAPPGEAYYDNSDGSLQFISENIKMYHFLYGEGWVLPQHKMLTEHCFSKRDYMEFAALRDGVLSRYAARHEITFAGQPFIPPKAYNRGRRSARRPAR